MPAVPIDEQDLYERAAAVLGQQSSDGELGPLAPLHGGQSSLTYWATYQSGAGELRVVVKVAPAGLAPTKNRDVLRQARLQRALQGTDVPCPAVLAEHEGAPPEVPPFFVMTFEAGDCVEPSTLPTGEELPPDEVRDRELETARILGRLHALDPVALGLGDEPSVTPEEELKRWSTSFDACDEDLRIGHEEVRDALAAGVPAKETSTLVHGDFRLGNTLSEGHLVTAVIDWEIWARSDPRVDVGWYLMMCNPEPELERTTVEGMPSNAELIDVYQRARGRDLEGMPWFEALVRYKQAAITALLIRNARRRDVDIQMNGTEKKLLRSANQLLGSA